jgi:hypothetical protein
MKQRSPTIEGFRLMFAHPALGLAEIAWRWTFGATTFLCASFLLIEYLRTLPISPSDLFLIRTRHPLLISQAVAHIFQGSGSRVFSAGVILFVLLSAAWIFLASWARTATVNALLSYFREEGSIAAVSSGFRRRSPVGVNLLRVVVAIAALCACAGAFVLGKAASPPAYPSAGRAVLVAFCLLSAISVAWWLLNWILSLAAIFVVADGANTFRAISRSIDLWRARWSSISAAGTWFGIAHAVAFFIATSVAAFPLAFVGILPAGFVLGGLLLVTLLYFAAADFLHAGKMASYVAIAKQPQFVELPRQIIPQLAAIDQSELILSDKGTV